MEFNALRQYSSTSDTLYSYAQKQPRHVPPIMYPLGLSPSQSPHPHLNQRSCKPTQTFGTWSAALDSFAPSLRRRHNTNLIHESTSSPSVAVPANSASRPTSINMQTIPTLVMYDPAAHADALQHNALDFGSCTQKTFDDFILSYLDPNIQGVDQTLLDSDESTPIVDLNQTSIITLSSQARADAKPERRPSESSFFMSSTSHMADLSTFEDLSSAETVSCTSDYDTWSNLDPGPVSLSPIASPRRSYHEGLKAVNRPRGLPGPHVNARSSPYSLNNDRNKRWSTGMWAPTSSPLQPRTSQQAQNKTSSYGSHLSPQKPLQHYRTNSITNFPPQTQNLLYSQPHQSQPTNVTLFSSADQPHRLEVPYTIPSQDQLHFRQSTTTPLTSIASLSPPPDLYAPLAAPPHSPPGSDMHPTDASLQPHAQEPRFAGDLYTPRWVRGTGHAREGWCGHCGPAGRWLQLKNSAYWYDKSFAHGVSHATGVAFEAPRRTRRAEGKEEGWEGECGGCGGWVPLVSSKGKGTTWFRHAYKCHNHLKVKDGPPKCRRETTRPPPRPKRTDSPFSASLVSSASGDATSLDPKPSLKRGPSDMDDEAVDVKPEIDASPLVHPLLSVDFSAAGTVSPASLLESVR